MLDPVLEAYQEEAFAIGSSITRKLPVRRDGTYYIENEPHVSTTEVLTALAKPALIPWAARLVARAIFEDPDKYDTIEKAAAVVSGTKSDAAGRGTAVHDLVEAWAGGKPLPQLAPELEGYGRAFDSFCRAWRPQPLHSECVVVNRTYKYAGRLDLIAQLGGETWLIDFKTAKSVWADYGLQLTAYKNAEFFRLPKETGDLTLYPMPQVDKTGVVLLRPNGTFDFVQVDEPFEVFLALMRVHEWMKSK